MSSWSTAWSSWAGWLQPQQQQTPPSSTACPSSHPSQHATQPRLGPQTCVAASVDEPASSEAVQAHPVVAHNVGADSGANDGPIVRVKTDTPEARESEAEVTRVVQGFLDNDPHVRFMLEALDKVRCLDCCPSNTVSNRNNRNRQPDLYSFA